MALSAASLLAGYHLGKFYVPVAGKGKEKSPGGEPRDVVGEAEEGEKSDEEDIIDGDLSAIQAGFMEPCKMVNDTGNLIMTYTSRIDPNDFRSLLYEQTLE